MDNNNEIASIFNFFNKAYRLRNVDRCSTLPKFRPNTVDSHSYYFCLMCMVLGEIENHMSDAEEKPNIGLMIRRGLVHDLEESLTGDILFTTHQASRSFRQELLNLRHKIATEELFSDLWMHEGRHFGKFSKLWETAKDETPEGRFLYYVDKLELLFVANEELKMGNIYFKEIFNNCYKILLESPFHTIKSLSMYIHGGLPKL